MQIHAFNLITRIKVISPLELIFVICAYVYNFYVRESRRIEFNIFLSHSLLCSSFLAALSLSLKPANTFISEAFSSAVAVVVVVARGYETLSRKSGRRKKCRRKMRAPLHWAIPGLETQAGIGITEWAFARE